MIEKTELAAQMDKAAEDALKELRKDMTGQEVADWMRRHYNKAGYKRLSKGMMNFFRLTTND